MSVSSPASPFGVSELDIFLPFVFLMLFPLHLLSFSISLPSFCFSQSPQLSLFRSSAPSTSIHFADIRLSDKGLFKTAQFDLILVWGENRLLCYSPLSLCLVVLNFSKSPVSVCVVLITVILQGRGVCYHVNFGTCAKQKSVTSHAFLHSNSSRGGRDPSVQSHCQNGFYLRGILLIYQLSVSQYLKE